MRATWIHIVLLVLALILTYLEISLGSVDIPLKDVFSILKNQEHTQESWSIIVLETRLPRALAAMFCGAFLSIGGLMMQTLFRNPLAGPHILGVSAGSSLGVALVVLGLGLFGVSASSDIAIVTAAFIGSMGILIILFLISLRVRDILTVLIFGILLSAVSLALVGILQYLSPESQLKAFLIWTLGSFDGVELHEAFIMIGGSIPFVILIVYLLKPLNLFLIGEEYASSLGLDVKRYRLLIMIATGGLTALVTAYCGPIGFIGVIVPHFARMLFKSFDHRSLILGSALLGMNVMLFSDLLAHLPGSEHILPINSITSLIGIPFIFWMLMKKKMIASV